jgi:hypothetical protein
LPLGQKTSELALLAAFRSRRAFIVVNSRRSVKLCGLAKSTNVVNATFSDATGEWSAGEDSNDRAHNEASGSAWRRYEVNFEETPAS